MKFLICLFCLLTFSGALYADEVNLNTQNSNCVYTEKELDLFEQLSQKHLALLKKEAELNAKEKSLNEREAALQGNAFQSFGRKDNSSTRIYMQLPPSKAVLLLNSETPEKAAEILSQMPAAISGRLIDKMDAERSEIILKKMSEIQKP